MNGPWREDGGSEPVRRPALGVALVLAAIAALNLKRKQKAE